MPHSLNKSNNLKNSRHPIWTLYPKESVTVFLGIVFNANLTLAELTLNERMNELNKGKEQTK